jgi:hypothetical protein
MKKRMKYITLFINANFIIQDLKFLINQDKNLNFLCLFYL